MSSEANSPTHVEVLILGAGFAGLAVAKELKASGLDSFLLLEKASGVGGTWQVNTYPGCACDVPSSLYSFSFAQNPGWSRRYSPQPEILAYLERVTTALGLRANLRLGCAAAEAAWDDAACRWTVTCESGAVYTARFLVAAMGSLSRPSIPKLPGLATFAGTQFHSQAWNHGVALEGKRVGVVGTGASAVQFIPPVAKQAAALTVFQRTAHWVLPRRDGDIPAGRRALFAAFPLVQRLVRWLIYLVNELILVLLLMGPRGMRLAAWLGRRHLAQQVKGAALREQLTPRYAIGCKRVLLSNDYYPALAQQNVAVVTRSIAEVTPRGVRTDDGVEHPLDVLILATGFHVTDAQGLIPFRGRGGLTLSEVWERDGAQAYLGTTLPGFPNLFWMAGPNTGIGHTSLVLLLEGQARYVADAVRRARAAGLRAVELKPEALVAFNAQVQRKLQGTIWASGCKSWYLDAKGVNRAIWPDFTFAFTWRTRRFDLGNYAQRA